jgi:4-diphosphocytidyl-2-C-methyl-D-erythritol kinase
MLSALDSGDPQAAAAACFTVLEPCCTCAQVPVMKRALLESGALGACMTGSGTAVFGVFADADSAQKARNALSRLAAWTCVARTDDRGARIVRRGRS